MNELRKGWRSIKADIHENRMWIYPLLIGNILLLAVGIYRLWQAFQ